MSLFIYIFTNPSVPGFPFYLMLEYPAGLYNTQTGATNINKACIGFQEHHGGVNMNLNETIKLCSNNLIQRISCLDVTTTMAPIFPWEPASGRFDLPLH